MNRFFYLFAILLFLAGCGKSNESKNPAEIVSRDSDTVFNHIPGKHHLGRKAFNMNIVDFLENERKANAFLDIVEEAGLRDTLETEGPFTVFALSNATLSQSETAGGNGSASDVNMDLSGDEIKKYLIKGKITIADLADQPVTATDFAGNPVTIRWEQDKLVINDKAYNTSEEFNAENGVIYELQEPLE